MTIWHVLTGEYPPQFGGVSDYSHLVAKGLSMVGDEVHVWVPGPEHSRPKDIAVVVHRLPDHFGPRSFATLSNALTGDGRLLVQYVPHAFGAKAMNLAFCAWLFSRRERTRIDVMFHEVASPITRDQRVGHNILGVVTRIMALIVAHAATRAFVAIPAWEQMLRPLLGDSRPLIWLPVPSNIPVVDDDGRAKSTRRRYCPPKIGSLIGHFGTYSKWTSEALKASVVPVLESHLDVSLLLIGSHSESYRLQLLGECPMLAERVSATGELSAEEVSRHIIACDLMVQPYPDGISSRRTSAMAVLAHGRAMITTLGHLTEPLWREAGAVAMAKADNPDSLARMMGCLIRDEACRARLGEASRRLYSERFDVTHTIAALRAV